MADYVGDLTLAARSAAEVYRDPSLAVATATAGGNIQQNAEVTSHLLNTQSTMDAVNSEANKHGGHGLLGATLGWIGGGIQGAAHLAGMAVMKLGDIANKPLEEVQHQYRYLRDVESQHGFAAMIGQSIPLIIGGTIGGIATGGSGQGITLGAEAGEWLFHTAGLGYRDSWDRTGSDNYVDPHGGQAVSPGRDAARFLGSLSKHVGVHIEQHKGFDLYDAVSGLGDGVFDVALDPLTQVGALHKQALSAEGAKGLLAVKWGGTAIKGTDLAVVTAQYPSVRRGLERLATMDAGDIAAKYKKLTPFANELGEAGTWQEVGQVLKDNVDAANMKLRTLPRQSLANVPFSALVDGISQKAQKLSLAGSAAGPEALQLTEDSGRAAQAVAGTARRVGETYKRATNFVPTSFNEATKEISRTTLYLNDPGSSRTIYEMAKWGHTEEMARKVAGMWSTGTLPERMTIFRNVMTDNLVNRMEALTPGWASTAEGQGHIQRLADGIDHIFGGIDAGRTTPWGFDTEGRIISTMPNKGQTISAPLLEKARINVPMPDYMTFDRNLKALSGHGEMYGAVDDFLYKHFTQNVFKRWVLATGGFAMRVSTGELIPYVARDPMGVIKSKVANSLVKRGWALAPEEEDHVLSVLARGMAGRAGKAVGLDDQQLEWLANSTKANDGHIVSSAVSAGHSHGQEIIGTEEYVKDSIYNLKQQVPKKNRVTEEIAAWGPEHDDHWTYWQKQAQDIGEQSPAMVAAAQAYKDEMGRLGITGDVRGSEEAKRLAGRKAIAAAQKVLDETPDAVLEQNIRHFYGSIEDGAKPGVVGTDIRQIRPETARRAEPALYETTGEQLIGQQTVQGALPYAESGALPSQFRGQTTYGEIHGPFGATVPKRTMIEPPRAAVPPEVEVLAGHEAGPQLLEQPGLVDVMSPHADWAQTQVEFLKGTIYGQDGTLHDEILNAIAEGRAPDTEYMKNVPMEQRPARIIGAYEKPAAPDRLSDKVFRKLNGFIEWMAREPMFTNEMLKQEAYFRPMIEAGELSYEEALQRAQVRATNNMLPHIHNINERTLMAEHARNFVPFYFAQQQSYARLWRLLQEDPAAFRRVQLAYTKLADFGGIYDDNTGEKQFVMPGAGLLTGGVMKALGAVGIPVVNSLPSSFSGNLKSLASMSPFLEGGELSRPGPLVALGVRAINNLIPETKQATDPLMGEQGSVAAWWEMLVPNAAMRSTVKAFVGGDNRTQVKSVLDAIQALEYQQTVAMTKYLADDPNHTPDDPKAPHIVPSATATDMERQDFINRVKNHARILTLVKAAVGNLSPVSPSLQLGNTGLKTELYDLMRAKDPATGQPYGVGGAIQEFLRRHPDATPYTVFATDSGTPSPIESTHPAQEWVQNNLGFIKDKRYSSAASYFVPQTDDKFDVQVYNEQMAMGLRHAKAPDQLIKDIHTSEGNRWYFDVYKPAKDAAVAKATSPHQRTMIEQQWRTQGGKDAKGEVVQSFESMKLQNPLWYSNFSSGARDVQRQLAIAQMGSAIQSGAAPDSPMTTKLEALLSDFNRHTANLLPGRTDSYASQLRKVENANWQRYLKKTAEQEPDLQMVINNVFRGA